MSVIFRATERFMADVRNDLSREHAFAHERVGFITVAASRTEKNLLILAKEYHAVADNDYIDDPTVGAMIGQEAFRKILEIALLQKSGVFHVHQHLFPGRLWFSRTDLREQNKFMPDFFKVRREMPHGALVLNAEMAAGRVWLEPKRVEQIAEFNISGPRINVSGASEDGSVDFFA